MQVPAKVVDKACMAGKHAILLQNEAEASKSHHFSSAPERVFWLYPRMSIFVLQAFPVAPDQLSAPLDRTLLACCRVTYLSQLLGSGDPRSGGPWRWRDLTSRNMKSLVRKQPGDNCASTLKSFYNYFQLEGWGFKEHNDWLFISVPLCFWYFVNKTWPRTVGGKQEGCCLGVGALLVTSQESLRRRQKERSSR